MKEEENDGEGKVRNWKTSSEQAFLAVSRVD
jgi:hypothetical protein